MASVSFRKVEGLGNDFVLLDRLDESPAQLERDLSWARANAARLCDRRTGIGADGVLLVGPGTGQTDASMIVVNADGSRAQMCGNGLRCVAAFVVERRGGAAEIRVETDAGVRACRVVPAGEHSSVSVEMGAAELLGVQRPAAAEGRELLGVSMGNPHAVCFVEAGAEALARALGPGIELDPVYQPEKTNVEFARLDADGSIELWVWERGVGITAACGTGACATAVAAVERGLCERGVAIDVRLPGGTLVITVPRDPAAAVQMVGPAREVFRGSI